MEAKAFVLSRYPLAVPHYALDRWNIKLHPDGNMIANELYEGNAWEFAAIYITDIFSLALKYANEKHANQTRKLTGTPYLSHLLAVAGLVLENGGDQDTAIAALLHDLLEDQSATFGANRLRAEISMYFGGRVLRIVEELTETDEDPKPPWRDRKDKYLAHIRVASTEARTICAADKLHNARTTLVDLREAYMSGEGEETVWAHFNADKESQIWWYTEVLKALTEPDDVPHALLHELAYIVVNLFK